MAFQIEDDVPVPLRSRGRARYPWDEMKPGQSFFVSLEDSRAANPRTLLASLCACAIRAFGKGNYITRIEGQGVRVWRLK